MVGSRDVLYCFGYRTGRKAARGEPVNVHPNLWRYADFCMGYEDGKADEQSAREDGG